MLHVVPASVTSDVFASMACPHLQEPPGFQLRLLTRLHNHDIVSSTYLPQFKMVAVSDRSGSVSLIDLAKPAVPWWVASACCQYTVYVAQIF